MHKELLLLIISFLFICCSGNSKEKKLYKQAQYFHPLYNLNAFVENYPQSCYVDSARNKIEYYFENIKSNVESDYGIKIESYENFCHQVKDSVLLSRLPYFKYKISLVKKDTLLLNDILKTTQDQDLREKVNKRLSDLKLYYTIIGDGTFKQRRTALQSLNDKELLYDIHYVDGFDYSSSDDEDEILKLAIGRLENDPWFWDKIFSSGYFPAHSIEFISNEDILFKIAREFDFTSQRKAAIEQIEDENKLVELFKHEDHDDCLRILAKKIPDSTITKIPDQHLLTKFVPFKPFKTGKQLLPKITDQSLLSSIALGTPNKYYNYTHDTIKMMAIQSLESDSIRIEALMCYLTDNEKFLGKCDEIIKNIKDEDVLYDIVNRSYRCNEIAAKYIDDEQMLIDLFNSRFDKHKHENYLLNRISFEKICADTLLLKRAIETTDNFELLVKLLNTAKKSKQLPETEFIHYRPLLKLKRMLLDSVIVKDYGYIEIQASYRTNKTKYGLLGSAVITTEDYRLALIDEKGAVINRYRFRSIAKEKEEFTSYAGIAGGRILREAEFDFDKIKNDLIR